MKTFGILYRYELKKLLRRKLTWAAMIALAGFCVFSIVRAGTREPGYTIPVLDEAGNETGELRHISGEEIRETYLKTAGTLDGRVMDDAFFQEMLESVPDFGHVLGQEDFETALYFWLEDATWHQAYNLAIGMFQDPRSVTAEEFYARQWELTRFHCENYHCALSQGEVDYWMEQAAKIQRPFIYQDYWRGILYLTDYFYVLLGLLPVAAAVCVCMVFSEDRRNRMEALVFTTKKSRAPLYFAKILAGVTAAVLAGIVIVGAVVAAHLAVWGTDGLDAAYQLYDITSPRPVTIWQMFLPMLMLLVLYTLVCGGVAMLVAAMTRSAIVSLAVPVLLAQVLDRWYLQPCGWAGYLPDNLIGWSGPYNLELVNIFGVYLNNFQFGQMLYLGISAALLALCWVGWRWSAAGRIFP